MTTRPKPIALLILDGWGYRAETANNPCEQASTPFIDSLFNSYPHRLIEASGEAVGLPPGQMGNSEVGHLHLGAGRLIRQDLIRINHSIEHSELKDNATLQAAIAHAKTGNNTVHLLGLLSPGGVHSHENHIKAMIQLLADQGIAHCYLHAFLDGRDVPPQSAESSLHAIEQLFKQTKNGYIASVCGRYYAMDRDQRWERTELAYDLLTSGIAPYKTDDALSALRLAYERGETDEFVKPTIITSSSPDGDHIQDGDVVIFMNFRADRARQLSHALTDRQFQGFNRKVVKRPTEFLSLTQYSDKLAAHPIFEALTIHNHLGEVLSNHQLSQLRLAETEKYPHVTYFFNGGNETPYPGEQRQIIASPKVATYDLQPEMSAIEVTDALCQAIEQQQYDVIICNYANPDMVGHTGIAHAAEAAMSTMDACLKRVVCSLLAVNATALITADHGNIECIYDEDNQQPHTAHTTNQVPLIYIGDDRHFDQKVASLCDIAPTLLSLAHIEQPSEITGRNLLHLDQD